MSDWPALRQYDGEHLARVALPLGGIGTGCVSIAGRGDLRDWELMNRPAKGFAPQWGRRDSRTVPFFTLWCEGPSGRVQQNSSLKPASMRSLLSRQ